MCLHSSPGIVSQPEPLPTTSSADTGQALQGPYSEGQWRNAKYSKCTKKIKFPEMPCIAMLENVSVKVMAIFNGLGMLVDEKLNMTGSVCMSPELPCVLDCIPRA